VNGSVLTARGVGYRRAGRDILSNVDVNVAAGEILAFVGPSGSGKSTLLALLSGLEQPDTGSVTSAIDPGDTAVVLQAYGLVSLLTAEENVAVPMLASSRRITRAEARQRTREALAELQLADIREHLVEELSGGQQQRVAFARALAVNPRLLLADEPTAALDGTNRHRLITVMRGLKERGATLVLATHDPVIAEMADRVVTIIDGRLQS